MRSVHNVNTSLVIEMGRICVDIPDDLERNLRLKVIERFGGKKGDLSRAVEEAIRKWVAEDEQARKE